MTYLIFIFGIILSFNLNAKQHYNLEEPQKKHYIGKEFTFNTPLIYISGLQYCNSLDKKIALNSKCFLLEKSKYKLLKLNSKCNYCSFQQKNNNKLIQTSVNYKPIFTVIDEYNVELNHFSYQLLGSNIEKVLLLKDKKGNYIETSVSFIKSVGRELNKKQKDLLALKDNFIQKQFCFNSRNQNRYQKLSNLISDFNLNIDIEENQCDRLGARNGFILKTHNFNHFLTFELLRDDYYINGKWF